MSTHQNARMIAEIGRALYGPSWQTETARTLNVADRTVRRWVSGDTRPARGAVEEMAGALEAHLRSGEVLLRRARLVAIGGDLDSRREQCAAALGYNRGVLARLQSAEVVETERGRITLGTLIGTYDAWSDGYIVTASASDVTGDWSIEITEDVREHRGEAGGRNEHGWLDEPRTRDEDGDLDAIAARLRGRARDALIVHLAQRLPSIIEAIEAEIADGEVEPCL